MSYDIHNLLEPAYQFMMYLEGFNPTILNYTNPGSLHECEHEVTLRLAKIAEEAGEVLQARIAQTGQNPRKVGTKTLEDVRLEICDVVFTSFVALLTIRDDPEAVIRDLHQRFTYIINRAGIES